MLGVIKFLGVNAAWQQTLFIVSSSQSIQCQREVTQMLYWGFKSPGAMLLRSKLFPYQDHQKLQVNTLLFKAFSFYRETNCCEWIIGESTLIIIGKYNADVLSVFIGKQTVELQANHPPRFKFGAMFGNVSGNQKALGFQLGLQLASKIDVAKSKSFSWLWLGCFCLTQKIDNTKEL